MGVSTDSSQAIDGRGNIGSTVERVDGAVVTGGKLAGKLRQLRVVGAVVLTVVGDGKWVVRGSCGVGDNDVSSNGGDGEDLQLHSWGVCDRKVTSNRIQIKFKLISFA